MGVGYDSGNHYGFVHGFLKAFGFACAGYEIDGRQSFFSTMVFETEFT